MYSALFFIYMEVFMNKITKKVANVILATTIAITGMTAVSAPEASAGVPCTRSFNGISIDGRQQTTWYYKGKGFTTRPGYATRVLKDLVVWFDRNIEPIAWGNDDWGVNWPPPRNTSNGRCSNHFSATAIDLNAKRHPMHKWNTFSPSKMRAIRSYVARQPNLQWGGNWTNPRDEMHFEYVLSKKR